MHTSTVDLVVRKATVTTLERETGYISSCSDHHPIIFQVQAQVEKATRSRRIAKTMLQSEHLRAAIGPLYELSHKQPGEKLKQLRQNGSKLPQTAEIQESYTKAEEAISEPWTAKAKKGGDVAVHT